MMRILSLGAGVQSSTLALMIAKGLVPMVECAIFADTQWESRKTYRWLDWIEKQLPFPVYRVTAGSLRETIFRAGRRVSIPWHMPKAMGMQQCTQEYKIAPIRRKMRELVGKRGKVEVLIGISIDEVHRMKPSGLQWITHSWPLIELRKSRNDCFAWLERNSFPQAPKSSCLGCPYHSDVQWREIKSVPDEWADVIEADLAIRDQENMRAQQFMHRSCKPIDEVEFANEGQNDLFGNDCSGLCGV